ncbi:hypothetical protein KIW84_061616 [Lathyrus oleraceus]|uniref:Uncharacterized protein n=1 Tax=Pisum sativum TaxID=3888 RepID=A0A9D5A763_PEA|nr:hypothetical protein KIW84_061616 [Pisum sativum]
MFLDGSSSCCCWANAERAATLLRLQEEPTTSYHLGRILKKQSTLDDDQYVEYQLEDLAVINSSKISIKNMMGSYIPFMIRPKKEQFDSDSDSGMLDFPEVPKASVQPSANFATALDRVIPPAVMPHLKVDFHSSSHFG